ncbi:hypothetical protein SOVF_194400, partial [Spinacia oleracea]
IFQSLLYEACGRVVDPIHGSVGLLYSGQWHHCQLAVDAVLKGLPIMQISPSSDLITSSDGPPHQILLPPIKLYDIRHMSSSKDSPTLPTLLVPTGPRLKRRPRVPAFDSDQLSTINGGGGGGGVDDNEEGEDNQSIEKLSIFSGESTEGSVAGGMGDSEVQLDLTLGFNRYGKCATN